MLVLIQLAAVVGVVICWAVGLGAYLASKKHVIPGARYVSPIGLEGLTPKGADLRRTYYKTLAIAAILALVYITIALFRRASLE